MNDIEIRNVCKKFGSKTILDNFSHTFKAGSITCIEGASGIGKTTLLNLIAGLSEPDSGSISGVPARIACVFQEDRLCEDFSAVSNIRLVCGKTKKKAEIVRHLSELSLSEDLKKPVRDFSGGMKRRVAIARVVCFDADCILMDEPFKGLDEESKKIAMDYVLRYTKGKTVICITHDNSEPAYLGAALITMGKPENVSGDPYIQAPENP